MNRTTLLEHLENDTLPDNLRARFVAWCVIEQALPALAEMLSETSLAGAGVALGHANDLNTISQLTSAIKHRAKELAGHGKTGTAAAAALFEFTNLVQTARQPQPDASAGAFFAARVCGWHALVYEGRHHPARKRDAEHRARRDQEHILRHMLETSSYSG